MSVLLLVQHIIAIQSLPGMPEQIHIALTENEGEMRATWSTFGAPTPGNQIYYGIKQNTYKYNATATAYTYTDGDFTGEMHTGLMKVTDGKRYYFAVGNEDQGLLSKEHTFEYKKSASEIKFLSYGDMGVKNSVGSVALMNKRALAKEYDLTVNVGDTSYADDYEAGHNAKIFDQHFRNIEGHAASQPFMVVAGNHEAQYHFAGFKNRLPMPKVDTATSALAPFYYSFDYGPVHFVVYSSEHPFSKGSEQWDFINRDLQAASAPAARAARPWIVVWSHRPLYCSDLMTWEDRCLHEATEYRANIEAMLLAAKVDLHISGHNHQYERSWPVSGCNKDYQGCTVTKSYHNPTQPVHIVNGAGGDVEGIDNSWIKDDTKVPFRAFNDIGFHTGFAEVSVNMTALHWQFFYSGDGAFPFQNVTRPLKAGELVDDFVITKGM